MARLGRAPCPLHHVGGYAGPVAFLGGEWALALTHLASERYLLPLRERGALSRPLLTYIQASVLRQPREGRRPRLCAELPLLVAGTEKEASLALWFRKLL